jgi:hypothetical protein
MEERNITCWEEFIEGVEEIRRKRAGSVDYVQDSPLLFRGQGNSCWQLSTTLERKRERMLYKDYYRIIGRIKPQIETLIGGDWPIPPYPEVERLVKTYDEFNNILWAGDRPAYAYRRTCDITPFRPLCSTGASHRTSQLILRLRTPAKTPREGYQYSFSASATFSPPEIGWTWFTPLVLTLKHIGGTFCSKANTLSA